MKKSNYHLLAGLLLISLCCSLGGCEHSTCEGYVDPIYHLSNQTGHTVSIAPVFISQYNKNDSLVLMNNDVLPVYPTEFKEAVLYYDSRYAIDHDDLPFPRRIGALYPYIKEPGTNNPFIFTLSPEDYDYAVEHGRDLGEKQ